MDGGGQGPIILIRTIKQALRQVAGIGELDVACAFYNGYDQADVAAMCLPQQGSQHLKGQGGCGAQQKNAAARRGAQGPRMVGESLGIT